MTRDSKKVFVCDDDKDALYMVTFFLTENGWHVSTSTNSNNIVKKVLESNPCVILMDINLPGQDGVSASRILKENAKTKHIPIVLFSADPDVKNKTSLAGTSFYLTKPFGIDKLKEVVTEAYTDFKVTLPHP